MMTDISHQTVDRSIMLSLLLSLYGKPDYMIRAPFNAAVYRVMSMAACFMTYDFQ